MVLFFYIYSSGCQEEWPPFYKEVYSNPAATITTLHSPTILAMLYQHFILLSRNHEKRNQRETTMFKLHSGLSDLM